jgi:hemerythrin
MDTIGVAPGTVNIDSIDITKEHDELRRLIDQAYIMMTTEPTCDNYLKGIVSVFTSIREVFSLHCRHEELIMVNADCAGIEDHKLYHNYVEQALASFVTILEAKLFPITGNTASHVKQWLNLHIIKHDVDFRNKNGL